MERNEYEQIKFVLESKSNKNVKVMFATETYMDAFNDYDIQYDIIEGVDQALDFLYENHDYIKKVYVIQETLFDEPFVD